MSETLRLQVVKMKADGMIILATGRKVSHSQSVISRSCTKKLSHSSSEKNVGRPCKISVQENRMQKFGEGFGSIPQLDLLTDCVLDRAKFCLDRILSSDRIWTKNSQ